MNILQQITRQSETARQLSDRELAIRLRSVRSDSVPGGLTLVNATACLLNGIRSRHTARGLASIAEGYDNEQCLLILETMERLMEE